jgi:hypothetical protein
VTIGRVGMLKKNSILFQMQNLLQLINIPMHNLAGYDGQPRSDGSILQQKSKKKNLIQMMDFVSLGECEDEEKGNRALFPARKAR